MPKNVYEKPGTFSENPDFSGPKSPFEQKVGIKNPPATEISSRGIGVLQVDLQVDITPSAWFYHAVVCFLKCLRIF
ncbi:hypothetical protein [uncultured Subdoligranulum sp.]|uniref:hypothetical protein n=1 Tax=uncultured Subdoligranulum sp. TaxID=512298 RepID=UPI0025EAED61|nr:hypothetical protein [uncultured Subdoligranulum sp.]